jgi:hypothetical protein
MSDELDRLVEKIGDAYFNRSCGRLDLDSDCLRQAINDALSPSQRTIYGVQLWREKP